MGKITTKLKQYLLFQGPQGAVTALILLNLMVFLTERHIGPSFLATFSLNPELVLQGKHLGSLVSSMFLHFNWEHIIGNMVFLLLFADRVIGRWGARYFIGFYLICGILTSVVSVALSPVMHSVYTLGCGASGAISSVMSANAVMVRKEKVQISFIVIFLFLTTIAPGVDYLAHFMGLMIGILGYYFVEYHQKTMAPEPLDLEGEAA